MPSHLTVELAAASGGSSELRARGELDMATAPSLASMLEQQLRAGRNQTRLDLSGVTFIDCAGLSVLIGSHHRYLSCQGALVLTAISHPARRLIALARLDDALFVDDVTVAVLPAEGAAANVRRCPAPRGNPNPSDVTSNHKEHSI